MALVRIVRILEYEGDFESIEHTLAHGGVPRNGVHDAQHFVIRSATFEYPTFLEPQPEDGLEECNAQR